MKKIIVHYPFKIDRCRAAASQLRPLKMVDAFESIGYEVYLIEGYGKERKAQIKRIKQEVEKGTKFEFVYSESNTTPTLLTEKHHYPTYPCLDFSFFRYCKKHAIPIGLFYRDIYWCFPENNKGIIRKMMKLFYKYDLHQYNKYVSTLFVPSLEMVGHIPFKFHIPVIELYPGCEKKALDSKDTIPGCNSIRVLYVGGIGQHYDLSKFIKVIQDIPDIEFTLCCRKEDWDIIKDNYTILPGGKVTVVHESGKNIEALYASADLFCLFVQPNKYWEFAVPFKLFETIGYGCPIIASEGTWVSMYVKKNDIGFVCGFEENDLKTTLENLIIHPVLLREKKDKVSSLIMNNTWEARCREVEKVLGH